MEAIKGDAEFDNELFGAINVRRKLEILKNTFVHQIELGDRAGYGFKVIDNDWHKQRRRYKPTEIQSADVIEDHVNRSRVARDNVTNRKVKVVNELTRKEKLNTPKKKKAVQN